MFTQQLSERLESYSGKYKFTKLFLKHDGAVGHLLGIYLIPCMLGGALCFKAGHIEQLTAWVRFVLIRNHNVISQWCY